MLIEHGNTDCTVPWQQSRQLVGALEAQIGKANVSMVVFDGSGHGGPAFLAAANLALVRRFFDAHLR